MKDRVERTFSYNTEFVLLYFVIELVNYVRVGPSMHM